MSGDPFQLERFVHMQDAMSFPHRERRHIDDAVNELRNGRKTSHWMWFIFPQMEGLGASEMARTYAISGAEEAEAYLEHPILGTRLLGCAELVAESKAKSAEEIFGATDTKKLRSSMTLFQVVSYFDDVFSAVLDRYFDGEPDLVTLDLLGDLE